MHCISAPSSIQELEKRFKTITGLTIYEIADILNVYIPNNLKKYKGFIGLLLEKYLGATASNKPQPDFINLGIEMKTLPLNKNIQPKESTYICKVPLTNDNSNWEKSRVIKKLSHVLWVPFEASEHIPLKKRKFAMPFLWKPNKKEKDILKQDWEELTSAMYMGGMCTLSAKQGTYLQVRPKAPNSNVLINTIDYDGYTVKTVPKGFYLKTKFTKQIIKINKLLWK